MKPELLDVVDLPDAVLQAGQLGTIVETYNTQAYEVEFADTEGAPLADYMVAAG